MYQVHTLPFVHAASIRLNLPNFSNDFIDSLRYSFARFSFWTAIVKDIPTRRFLIYIMRAHAFVFAVIPLADVFRCFSRNRVDVFFALIMLKQQVEGSLSALTRRLDDFRQAARWMTDCRDVSGQQTAFVLRGRIAYGQEPLQEPLQK